jgi:hypothetical protein
MKTYKLSTKKETKDVLKIIFDAEDEISYHGLVYIKMPMHYFNSIQKILQDNGIEIIIPYMVLTNSNYVIFHHTLTNYEFELDELNNTISLLKTEYNAIVTEL